MFQFSGFAHLSVYYVFNIVGCPIRISADQSMCARPRSFSQLITSFFASESLGIPHTPLFCLLYQSCQLKQDRFFLFSTINCKKRFLLFIIFLSQYVNELYLVEGQKSKVVKWITLDFMTLIFMTKIVENNGVEPLTSCVQGRRSSQLS